MNKRGDIGGKLKDVLIYVIFVVIFTTIMLIFLFSHRGGARVWGDYYAAEIARIIDFAEVGDEIVLDIHKATEIAKDNGIAFGEIFKFGDNRVSVKLDDRGTHSFRFFNNVDVVDEGIEFGLGDGVNKLKLKIVEEGS